METLIDLLHLEHKYLHRFGVFSSKMIKRKFVLDKQPQVVLIIIVNQQLQFNLPEKPSKD